MCSGNSDQRNLAFIIPPRIVIILLESSYFVYYSKELLRLKVKMKYHIMCELFTSACLWIIMRTSLTVQEFMADCLLSYPVEAISNYPEIMMFLLFLNIIVVPLFLMRRFS